MFSGAAWLEGPRASPLVGGVGVVDAWVAMMDVVEL